MFRNGGMYPGLGPLSLPLFFLTFRASVGAVLVARKINVNWAGLATSLRSTRNITRSAERRQGCGEGGVRVCLFYTGPKALGGDGMG